MMTMSKMRFTHPYGFSIMGFTVGASGKDRSAAEAALTQAKSSDVTETVGENIKNVEKF
ncbi:MAG: hypothetical protein LKE85_15870 [Lachnospiraceae bacterium]|nr:hypothetical protein [Lachnospiraceae bacterium]